MIFVMFLECRMIPTCLQVLREIRDVDGSTSRSALLQPPTFSQTLVRDLPRSWHARRLSRDRSLRKVVVKIPYVTAAHLQDDRDVYYNAGWADATKLLRALFVECLQSEDSFFGVVRRQCLRTLTMQPRLLA